MYGHAYLYTIPPIDNKSLMHAVYSAWHDKRTAVVTTQQARFTYLPSLLVSNLQKVTSDLVCALV